MADVDLESDRDRSADDTVVDLTAHRSARDVGEVVPGLDGIELSRDRGLLHRVAVVLNSTLDLRHVLKLLAAMALETADADRCTFFLLEGGELQPTASIGQRAHQDLLGTFHELGPINIHRFNERWRKLADGHAVVVESARTADGIPTRWIEAFDVEALAVVPLLAAGEPCGILVVDYDASRTFSDEEIAVLEALGAYAGVAVRNAQLHERTRRRAQIQEALARGAAQLTSPDDAGHVAKVVSDTFIDLLEARMCAIGLFSADREFITTIASRGARTPPAPVAVSSLPDDIVERLREQWDTDHDRGLTFRQHPWFDELAEEPTAFHLVLPLVVGGHTRGCVLLGFDTAGRLDPEGRAAARALTAIAASALERTELLGRLARHARSMEVLFRISTAIAEGADVTAIVERLNGLLAGHRIEIVSLRLQRRDLRLRFGGEPPDPAERRAWKDGDGPVELDDGTGALAMRSGGRTVGGLRIRPASLGDGDRQFIEVVAQGVADGVVRGALRAALSDADRDHAVAAERERIAADLHDIVGQQFVAITMLGRQAIAHLPADSPHAKKVRRLTELASGGKWEIDQAIRALSYVPAGGRGLVPALSELTTSFETDSGIRVLFDVDGGARRLDEDVERALYRVAHEALSNAWRHARCTNVHVGLGFDDDGGIELNVRDDGIGIGSTGAGPSDDSAGFGIRNIRRSMEEVGGDFRIRNHEPHGTSVTVSVPAETSGSSP